MIITEDKNNILEISDFEPFFLYYFGERIPENLKPIFDISYTTKKDRLQLLSEFESIAEVEAFFKKESIERNRFNQIRLRTLPESKNTDVQLLKVSSEFDPYTKMPKEELKKRRGDLRKLVKVKWLYNQIGEEYISYGIPNLEEMPNEVYQIGIRSSSSKDYFKYVSTSEVRKVGFRFMIWTQYEKIDEQRINRIIRFFNEFAEFEREVSEYVKGFTFYFDEFGTKLMQLRLNNSVTVEVRESNMYHSLNFDFSKAIKELENAIR